MNDPETGPEKPGLRTLIGWALPPLVGALVFAVTAAAGWTLWFGVMCVVSGALVSLMLIGRRYGVGE